mmetsp:Transcript_13046/g.28599  ORF Transcript_13046/g.28599 Transcript_13046/m.28599 type:complete len:101 (-) Transcript_13046:434-736(-)
MWYDFQPGVVPVHIAHFRTGVKEAYLTIVDLSNSVLPTAINMSTFCWNCKALKIIRLPPKLKEIHRVALEGCCGLVSIVIPLQLTSWHLKPENPLGICVY